MPDQLSISGHHLRMYGAKIDLKSVLDVEILHDRKRYLLPSPFFYVNYTIHNLILFIFNQKIVLPLQTKKYSKAQQKKPQVSRSIKTEEKKRNINSE